MSESKSLPLDLNEYQCCQMCRYWNVSTGNLPCANCSHASERYVSGMPNRWTPSDRFRKLSKRIEALEAELAQAKQDIADRNQDSQDLNEQLKTGRTRRE